MKMNVNFKKLFSILLCLCMLMQNVPLATFAAEGDVAAVIAGDGTEVGSYASMDDALAAWADGTTLKLLDDVTSAIVVNSGKRVTLDLNGHTLQSTLDYGNNVILLSDQNSKLTVKDSAGNGQVTSSDTWGLVLVRGGELEIQGGTFSNNDDEPITNTINLYNDAKLTVKGGSIYSNSNAAIDGQKGTEIIIEGGTIHSDVNVLHGAEAVISGGEIRGTVYLSGSVKVFNAPVVKEGFTIDNYISEFLDLTEVKDPTVWTINNASSYATLYLNECLRLPDCYQVMYDGRIVSELDGDCSGTIVVKHEFYNGSCMYCGSACTHDSVSGSQCADCYQNLAASVGGKGYENLDDALAAWVDGTTLKLLKDVTGKIAVNDGRTVTLDLNGFTLSDGSNVIRVDNENSKLIVKDSVGTGKVKNTLSQNGVVSVTTGELEIQGGMFVNNDAAPYVVIAVYDGGRVVVKDGSIVNNAGSNFGTINCQSGSYAIIEGGTFNCGFFLKGGSGAEISGGEINGFISLNGPVKVTNAPVIRGVFYISDESTAVLDLTGATDPSGWTVEYGELGSYLKLEQHLRLPDCYQVVCNGQIVTTLERGESGFVIACHAYQCVDNGDGTHDTVCSACGKYIDTYRHFFIAGICQDCGSECPHESVIDSVCTACSMKLVASVDGKIYENLDDALAAWVDGTTLKLLKDVTGKIAVNDGRTVTLDLNGFTLSDGYEVIWVENENSKLIVKDSVGTGKIKNTSFYAGPVVVIAGELEIQGGTVINNNIAPYCVIAVDEGGRIVVKGGSIVNNAGSNFGTIDCQSGSYAIIEGGTFNCGFFLMGGSGAEISGGEINGFISVNGPVKVTNAPVIRGVFYISDESTAVLDLTGATDPAGWTVEYGDLGSGLDIEEKLLLPDCYYVECNGQIVTELERDEVGTIVLRHDHHYVDNGDGTHDFVCSVCGDAKVDDEKHTYNSDTGVCTLCGVQCAHPAYTNYHCATCGRVQYFTITFSSADSLFKNTTITVAYGQKVTADMAPNTEFEHYTLLNWFDWDTTKDVKFPFTMPGRDMNIRCVHAGNDYFATVRLHNGEPDKEIRYRYDGDVRFVLRDLEEKLGGQPVRTGYTFTGWKMTDLNTGSVYVNEREEILSDKLLIEALWTINSYTVTFMVGDQVYSTGSCEYDSTIELPKDPTELVAEGLECFYAFEGWEGYTNGMKVPAQDVTFTAKFSDTVTHKDVEPVYDNITDHGHDKRCGECEMLLVSQEAHTVVYDAASDADNVLLAFCTVCGEDAIGSVVVNVTDKTYDGQPAEAVVTAYGSLKDETILVTYTKNGTALDTAPTNAGTYAASVTIGGVTVRPEFTIAKVPLTIQAKDAAIIYGDAPINNGVSYDGFIPGEDETVLQGSAAFTYSYQQYGRIGTYAICVNGLASQNYQITFVDGKLDVAAKPITITAEAQTITFGETISGAAYAADGLIDGHTAAVTLTPSTEKVTVNGTITPGAAVITADGEDVTANYAITYADALLVIVPDTSKIDALTTENVTSANEDDIKAVLAMLENAESTKDEWAAIAENCTSLLEKIDAVRAENTRIAEAVAAYDLTTVKSSDEAAIVQLIADIDAQLATDNLTNEERNELEGLKTKCDNLIAMIDGVEALIALLEETVAAMDAETINSSEEAVLEQIIADAQTLIDSGNVTEEEAEIIKQIQADAEELLDVIEEARETAATENVEKTEDVTAENITPGNKTDLEKAKEDLEEALEEFGDNYTEEEIKAIEEAVERIEAALEVIEHVESVEEVIADLPEKVDPDDEKKVAKIEAAKKAYDALTEYEKSLVDQKAKEKLDALIAASVAYAIVKGGGDSWTEGGNDDLRFTANGSVSKFVGIKVDGKDVDAANYNVKSGSTIITLKASYLETLSAGEHTLTVVYTDGEASAVFKVLAKSNDPVTGDESNMMFWSSIVLMSMAAMAVLTVQYRKRRTDK